MMLERLYYLDSYLSRFQANILAVETEGETSLVYLDRSAFYPTSGGQPHDGGFINGCPVLEVSETPDGRIIHRVRGAIEGGVADCQVDWVRRFDHMQQHTGQHILSQAFLAVAHANTVGFHLGVDCSTIDLDCEILSAEKVCQVEDLANSIIHQNRMVEIRVVDASEVAPLGLRKESRREGPLRIVEVIEFDISACGGTHVRMTGEIGMIALRKLERVNRQLRIEFLCGSRAVNSYRELVSLLNLSARKFSAAWSELPERIEKSVEEGRDLRKKLQDKNRQLASAIARQLYVESAIGTAERPPLIKRLFEGEDLDFLKLIAQAATAHGPCLVLLGNRSAQAQLVLSQHDSLNYDLRAWISEACQRLEGRGGGTRTFVQGGGKNCDALPQVLDWMERQIRGETGTKA
jgi:alanyl-tRNA synthetase